MQRKLIFLLHFFNFLLKYYIITEMSSTRKQHGIKGCYYGGEWVDVEDLTELLPTCKENNDGASRSNMPMYDASNGTYPRSKSNNCAMKSDGTYDIVIIGAGCIGGAIARELSKTQASVLVLEAADDIAQGATKGNSGIVHAGYDDKPGSVRAKYCWAGNQMFPQLDRELHFGYQKNGSLVVAFNEEQVEELNNLLAKGKSNGVKNLRIIGQEELHEMEPHLHKDAIAALHAPDAGNLIPYEYAIALMENAISNGVECRLRREVTNIECVVDAVTSPDHSGSTSPVAPSGRKTRSSSRKNVKTAIAIESDIDEERLFTITARYWEPKAYLDLISKKTSSVTVENTRIILVNVIVGAAASFAVVFSWLWVVFLENIPEMRPLAEMIPPALEPYLAMARQLHATQPHVLMYGHSVALFCVLLVTLSVAVSTYTTTETTKRNVDGAKTTGEPTGPPVSIEEMKTGGTGSMTQMKGEVVKEEVVKARYVINCAGSASDKIAGMIGDNSFQITPRIGDYLLLHKDQGHLAHATIFPCPDPKLGKGVLVQTTLWGNLILGPTARDFNDEKHMGMSTKDIQKYILLKCQELVPSLDATRVIHAFAGSRAKSTRGDWIIEASEVNDHMINVAGIDSPGLAGSPAIALAVMDILAKKKDKATVAMLKKNPNFNPNRNPLITPKDKFWKNLKVGPLGKFTDPKENVVCKCEKVTELEVIEACHRGISIDSTQAIRKRTRAGMGSCQGNTGNYDCEHRVASIIARETGLPYEQVGRRPWPGTSTLWNRWMSEEEKTSMVKQIHE